MADGSSDPVFALSDKFVEDYCKLSPMSASMAGVPGAFDGWDDYSPEGGVRAAELFRSYRAQLDALPPPTDRWARVAHRVLSDFLAEKAAYYEHEDNLCDLNNIESPLQHLRVIFDVMDTSERAGWEAVATRLSTIDKPLAQYTAALEAGVKKGLVSSKRQTAAALTQAENNASERSSFHEILKTFDAANIDDAALRARIASGIEHTKSSFGEFTRALKRYAEHASDKEAFGKERYRRAAYRFLGMDIDPLETYQWGLQEIATIETAMRKLAEQIAPGLSLPEVVKKLQSSKEQLIESKEEFLTTMRERQAAALAGLMGTHFDVPEPIRRIEIRLAPAGGALGAYYFPPNEGFTRPGTVYYAPAEGQHFTLFTEVTTAYHEGFPGHHLQCGLQVYLAEHLSRLHRLFVVCSGYAEGWALYAEELMDELGYLDRPEYVLGMRMAKLFRAIRVVVDIGMHLELKIPAELGFRAGETWGYDACVEILNQRAFIPLDFAKSEAVRYLGWPGQAISYKVGERVILDLREETKKRRGENFDLRSFHEAVLNSGSVGLDHLRAIVREQLP